MGSPELPNDPGDEDLCTSHIIHHPPVASDDSDNDSMADPAAAYEGYQPLSMDENQMDYGRISPADEIENFNNVQATGDDDNANVEVIHGDPNMPQIESVDAEVEREVWSEPRPRDLHIELDSNKTEQILNAMASITLPHIAVPSWAAGVPEERWKEELLQRIRQRKQSGDSSRSREVEDQQK